MVILLSKTVRTLFDELENFQYKIVEKSKKLIPKYTQNQLENANAKKLYHRKSHE